MTGGPRLPGRTGGPRLPGARDIPGACRGRGTMWICIYKPTVQLGPVEVAQPTPPQGRGPGPARRLPRGSDRRISRHTSSQRSSCSSDLPPQRAPPRSGGSPPTTPGLCGPSSSSFRLRDGPLSPESEGYPAMRSPAMHPHSSVSRLMISVPCALQPRAPLHSC
jgi:hypothetical protein